MPDLFNLREAEELISRIDKLDATSPPLWGKMNVSQMLAHCQVPMRVALGEVKLKSSIVGLLFGKIAKKRILAEGDFAKNLPTDKHFVIRATPDFEEQKNRLKDLIRKFQSGGPQGLTRDKHPFFGTMSTSEWSLLSYKHLDHHLRQFGA